MPREPDGRPGSPVGQVGQNSGYEVPDWLSYMHGRRPPAAREIPYDDPQALADLIASGQLIFVEHNGEVGYAWNENYVSPAQRELNEWRDQQSAARDERETRSRQLEDERRALKQKRDDEERARQQARQDAFRQKKEGGGRDALWWMDQVKREMPQIQPPQWTPYAPQGNAPQGNPREMWQAMMSQWSGR